jgi:hypothetical protein
LPDPGEPVSIRAKGAVRPAYFRIHDRWYAFVDLERWQMNTSPYWPVDQVWYLTTDQIEAWRPAETLSDPE